MAGRRGNPSTGDRSPDPPGPWSTALAPRACERCVGGFVLVSLAQSVCSAGDTDTATKELVYFPRTKRGVPVHYGTVHYGMSYGTPLHTECLPSCGGHGGHGRGTRTSATGHRSVCQIFKESVTAAEPRRTSFVAVVGCQRWCLLGCIVSKDTGFWRVVRARATGYKKARPPVHDGWQRFEQRRWKRWTKIAVNIVD